MNMLQTIELHPGAEPRATIVILHGLGADGTDFLSFADELKLGPVRWVFPRAPVRPVTINNGYRMRAWYDVLGPDLAIDQRMHRGEALAQAGADRDRAALREAAEDDALGRHAARHLSLDQIDDGG